MVKADGNGNRNRNGNGNGNASVQRQGLWTLNCNLDWTCATGPWKKHSRSLLCPGPVRLSYAVGNAH